MPVPAWWAEAHCAWGQRRVGKAVHTPPPRFNRSEQSAGQGMSWMWNSGSFHIMPSWLSLELDKPVLRVLGAVARVGQGPGGTVSWSKRGVQKRARCSEPAMLEPQIPAL